RRANLWTALARGRDRKGDRKDRCGYRSEGHRAPRIASRGSAGQRLGHKEGRGNLDAARRSDEAAHGSPPQGEEHSTSRAAKKDPRILGGEICGKFRSDAAWFPNALPRTARRFARHGDAASGESPERR